jgi:hypothetical protein
MSTASQIDIDKIKSIVAKNPRYRAIFEYFHERHRGRQGTTVSRMRRMLKESGRGDYSLDELKSFFQKMQEVNAGEWINGRHGKEGRFAWKFHLVTVASAVLNKKSKNFARRGNDHRPLKVGTILPAPANRVALPKVVMTEPEHHEDFSSNVQHGDRRQGERRQEERRDSERRPSYNGDATQKMVRYNFSDGSYLDIPLGMNTKEQAEMAETIKIIKKINNIK